MNEILDTCTARNMCEDILTTNVVLDGVSSIRELVLVGSFAPKKMNTHEICDDSCMMSLTPIKGDFNFSRPTCETCL